MAVVRAKINVPHGASLAEQIWYDPQRWASLLDGFGRLGEVEDDWPHVGAAAVWHSSPGGRGRVTEVVTEYVPRDHCITRVHDDSIIGTQTITFRPHEEGTEIELALEYSISKRNPFTPVMDVLFVRGQQRLALQRTLDRLRIELRGEQDLGA